MRTKPFTITIPPFINEKGDPEEFWAWVMIAFLVILYAVMGW